MSKTNKTGITIKGGNVTRLGLLDKILNLTDKLTSTELRGEYTYGGYQERPFKNGEIEAIAKVYQTVAETISSIDTNSQGIMVTNCNFSGMDLGIKVEQSPEENTEESAEEAMVETDEDNENDEEKCADCEYYSKEDSSCNDCKFKEYKGIYKITIKSLKNNDLD